MRWKYFQTVPSDAKGTALEGLIIALILLRNKVRHHLALIVIFTGFEILRHRTIGFDRPDPIDTRYRSHDDNVIPFQQSAGCRMAHSVNLFVYLAFFFNIGVRACDISFGLVIIIKADKIFD